MMEFAEELALFGRDTTDPGFQGLIVLGTGGTTPVSLLVGTLTLQKVAFLLTHEAIRDGFLKAIAHKLEVRLPDEQAKQLDKMSAAYPVYLGSVNGAIWEAYLLEDASDIDVYKALVDLLDRWKSMGRTKIAADVTGGTKPMTVGLAKAAHILNLPTIYIASDRDPVTHQPQPGTQRLEILRDPYIVFGHLEAAEAERLFANHDYNGAARIFTDLARRVSTPTNKTYSAYSALAQGYAAWDSFDLPTAEQILAKLLDTLPTILEPHRVVLEQQRLNLECLSQFVKPITDEGTGAEVGRQLELVQRHDNVDPTTGRTTEQYDLTVLADPDKVLPLLGTLYTNGLRRGEVTDHAQDDPTTPQRRYDMAAMLLYRCLELMSQHRLARYEILTGQPDYDRKARKDHPTLDTDYDHQHWVNSLARWQRKNPGQPLPARPHNRGRQNPPQKPLGLFDGYTVLAALDDPLIRIFAALDKGYDIVEIEARNFVRNQSILTHGYRLLTHQDYANFKTVVDKVLDGFFAALTPIYPQQNRSAPTRAEWEATYRFINPFETAGG